MNNNDFYGNLDKIRRAYLQQDYDEAVRIADKMDFKRLKEWKYIAMLSNLYEAVGRLEDVKYFCTLAYNRNLGGKKLLYKLTKVLIRLEEIDDAEELYDEFLLAAPKDIKRYELMYELKAVQGAKKSELIRYLEEYTKRSLDEKYSCILADLYAKTGQNEKCVYLCTQIIEQFETGSAVEKAMALKNELLSPVPGKAQTTMAEKNAYGAQNVYDTQGIAPQQGMYDTQSFAPQQGMYDTQSFAPQQGMYDTQSLAPQQGMYDTQSFAPQQGMYDTQSLAPQQEMYDTQSGVPQNEYSQQNTEVVQSSSDVQGADDADLMGATREIPVEEIRGQREAMRAAANVVTENTVENDIAANVSEIMETNTPKEEDVAFAQIVDEVDTDEAKKKSGILAATGTIDLSVVEETMAEQSASQNAQQVEVDSSSVDAAGTAMDVATDATTDAAIGTAPQEGGINEPANETTAPEVEAAPEISGEDMTMGETIRVDTQAINTAVVEAAATMDQNFGMKKEQSSSMMSNAQNMEGTQDIESTMAMVEAALANETRAAQFDARMDMPEYSEEYTAPVKDKVTLRPFQPEIDRVYEIPFEVKRYFVKYSLVAGLEAQIGEYFESTKHEDKMGTSGIGNIVISGNRSSDKTSLAINIVKALNTLYPENVRKIARTTGDNINQRGIERSISKLLGAALIIEEAGVIDRQRILEMIQVMESDTQELLIILEDSESEINELLKNNPELIEKFNHRISYKQFTVNELVEMCKRYADKCQYTIDEKALLQLYLRIDEIHSSEDGVSLEDVRDVVDEAIENANRRASKKLFGGVKKKKIDDKEYTILVEADFK
ncbi:MAG: hypothetical protein ACI4AQ_11170 [Lachnospiraceae bacterium]